MRVALARSAVLPSHEHDDDGFVEVLASHGVAGDWRAWDDPSVDWAAYDAVFVRTTWDYQERPDAFRAWIRAVDAQTRLFNPAEVLLWNLDKRYLRELELAGIPIAPTEWLAQGEDPAPALQRRGWARGFLKPVVGATAIGTLRFTADEAGIAAARAHARDWSVPLMLQPYLRSVEEEGEVSVVLVDGRISHAVRKIPVAGDYRVQDDWGAIDQPLGLFQGEDDFALDVLAALQKRFDHAFERRAPLVARVDTLRDDRNRLVLNELELVEPSLFYRHGPDAMDAVARALVDRLRG
ncbi:MAG: hypothetical protein H6737_29670 [Alphaproteobacteria bacterium]|nr:hypothetical protein [Alphaproteobacteria bacterium]